MKRLSKSASDLSGCKKKTHSTSPEEEEKPIPYTTPCHSDDEEHPRPSSAASRYGFKFKSNSNSFWSQAFIAKISSIKDRLIRRYFHMGYTGKLGYNKGVPPGK